MAFKKVYVPLSLLTTKSLQQIRGKGDLKYTKISVGNGVDEYFLNTTCFPSEASLTRSQEEAFANASNKSGPPLLMAANSGAVIPAGNASVEWTPPTGPLLTSSDTVGDPVSPVSKTNSPVPVVGETTLRKAPSEGMASNTSSASTSDLPSALNLKAPGTGASSTVAGPLPSGIKGDIPRPPEDSATLDITGGNPCPLTEDGLTLLAQPEDMG
ncbi:hypothetical protein BU17DRAFT_94017 [Hysterangium stoloniferum]|nr:hypothetical protein BU17DRAFT_94017 [Hysterangium stoloniferum]